MYKIGIFIISLLSVTGCSSNILNSDDIQLAGGYIEGCIEEVENQIYIYNESTKVLLKLGDFSVGNDLIVGENYKIEYEYILETNPTRAKVINYEGITNNNFCG